ncbi:MAG: ElyC/SanA/YdcF family protein [Arcobacteraceae bacterium]
MDFAFTLKKIISAAIMPLSITLLLLLIGLLFLDKRTLKKAQLFLTIGFICLVTISYQPFSNTLLNSLESKYQKLDPIPQNIQYILLLGGDVNNRGWEALRLYHKIENAKIITSGYEGSHNIPEAIRTANLFYDLGIPQEDIIIHTTPKDTKEEAIKIKEVLGVQPFILVTSAYHMPRAMALFQKEGLHPIAAPTDFRVKKTKYGSVPKGKNLLNTEIALHEYIGLVWSKIKGQI